MDSRSAPVTREGESRVDQISITAELIQTYAAPLFQQTSFYVSSLTSSFLSIPHLSD